MNPSELLKTETQAYAKYLLKAININELDKQKTIVISKSKE